MIGLARSKPTKVWCHCYGTTEPSGAWRYPDSDHAYTCGMRWLTQTAVRSVPAGRWLGQQPGGDPVSNRAVTGADL